MKATAEARLVPGGVLLRLRDELGNVGFGEAAPLEGRSPESRTVVLGRLSSWSGRFASASHGFDHDTSLDAWMERMLGDDLPPSAAFAAETAILDLLGKRRGVPVHRLLRAGTAGAGAIAPVPLNALVGLDDGARGAADALERGIRTVKLKIGGAHFDDERARILALRREIGSGIALRVDVNGAWGAIDAPAHLAALVEADLEYVEQPLSAVALPVLPSSPIPLAADESVADATTLARILRAPGPVKVLVLKPALLGGLRRSLAIARRAMDAGLDVVVTHLMDGPVSLAAAGELALALPRPPRACGLDRHENLARWPAFGGGRIGQASVVADDRPGLGLVPPKELL